MKCSQWLQCRVFALTAMITLKLNTSQLTRLIMQMHCLKNWINNIPSQKEVLAAIASGELFTPEYQERERQRKAAALLERKKRQAETNALHSEQSASLKPKPKPVYAEFNPYAGKKSGDYVGD